MNLIKEITDKEVLDTEGLSTKEPRLTVRAFLFDEERRIAVMYADKFKLYSIPGGGIEPGESHINALTRELLEETGCECEILNELGYVYENRAQMDYTTCSYYYIAKVKKNMGVIKLTEAECNNGTSIEWHTIEDAKRLISDTTHENIQRKFLQKRDLAAFEALAKYLNSFA